MMKRSFAWFLLYFAVTCAASAQVVDSSICDILAKPQSFDGKVVRVKGTVIAGFDEFMIKDSNCGAAPEKGIWLAYPEGANAKAGPIAILQLQLAKNSPATVSAITTRPVQLEKNNDFKQFDSLLSSPYKGRGMCLGCVRYTVTATLVGRLDGVSEVGTKRDAKGRFIAVSGFGNMNAYKTRLVIQSVANVTPQEIDYSKASSATKDDSQRETGGGDPVVAAHAAAQAFGSNSDAGHQVERAAAAFGAPGEDNGVTIGFGAANEIPKNDRSKGDADSPDGLLLNCILNMDRLKGDALTRAISHVGTHIADIRDPGTAGSNTYTLENHAWQTAVLSAMAVRQKTLTLPGGYLVWNAAWPPADRGRMVEDGVSKFLTEWMAVSK